MSLPRPLLLIPLAGALLLGSAFAGLFGKRTAPEPAADPEPKPASDTPKRVPGLPAAEAIFDQPRPYTHGPLPKGLANASSQGCAACHAEAVRSWSRSGHAAPPPERLVAAATFSGRPDCLSCHLPLDVQHRQVIVAGQAGAGPSNPAFDLNLAAEGVTCASCHVRDGHVVAARADTQPPHATKHSPELRAAQACASCHQFGWPGADPPLYDTFGEWQRSGWAKAGVSCQDCHMRPSVAGAAPTHDVALPLSQALSALVSLPPDPIVRGAPPASATLTLQNTGAGHAIPTGSPFSGLQLSLSVEGGPADAPEPPVRLELLQQDLQRTIADDSTWRVASDTRLSAGGQRSYPFEVALPVDAPRGVYRLVLTLSKTHGDEVEPQPKHRQTWPLVVR